jgi:hypothetical protein
MATYSAGDFIGKTIFITGRVPVYRYATEAGTRRPAPIAYLNTGDGFTVDTFVNKKGTYTNFDDHYWIGKSQGKQFAIAFNDIAGKYNAAAILSQGGIKSDEEKQKEQKEKEQGTLVTMLNKYLPLVLGTVVLAAVIRRGK